MRGIIYQFTNTVNNKKYVGMTTQTLERRVYLHWWVSNKRPTCHFHRALQKYAKDMWVVDILEILEDSTKEEIRQREMFYIDLYNTFKDGYNSTLGGEDFSDPEYQRALQNSRVDEGTHPFLGGEIQKLTGKRRWEEGTHNFIGLNQARVAAGTHNLLGENNPARRLAIEGKHHNQKRPWCNTKAKDTIYIWLVADKIYQWFQTVKHLKRGSSYKAAKEHFGFQHHPTVILSKIREGWNPCEDAEWNEWVEKKRDI